VLLHAGDGRLLQKILKQPLPPIALKERTIALFATVAEQGFK
jgi:hypothetical protein